MYFWAKTPSLSPTPILGPGLEFLSTAVTTTSTRDDHTGAVLCSALGEGKACDSHPCALVSSSTADMQRRCMHARTYASLVPVAPSLRAPGALRPPVVGLPRHVPGLPGSLAKFIFLSFIFF